MKIRPRIALFLVTIVGLATPATVAVEVATSAARATMLGDLSREVATPLVGLHLRYFARDVESDP